MSRLLAACRRMAPLACCSLLISAAVVRVPEAAGTFVLLATPLVVLFRFSRRRSGSQVRGTSRAVFQGARALGIVRRLIP